MLNRIEKLGYFNTEDSGFMKAFGVSLVVGLAAALGSTIIGSALGLYVYNTYNYPLQVISIGFVLGLVLGSILAKLFYLSVFLGKKVPEGKVLVLADKDQNIVGILRDESFLSSPLLNKYLFDEELTDEEIRERFDEIADNEEYEYAITPYEV